jgi:hypothetical protein
MLRPEDRTLQAEDRTPQPEDRILRAEDRTLQAEDRTPQPEDRILRPEDRMTLLGVKTSHFIYKEQDMAGNDDWYSGSRDGQLAMGKNWVVVLNVKGTGWKIPPEDTQALGAVVGEADAVLTTAKNETTRTPVVTAQCREVFGRMETKMRDIKKRYFYAPPLTDADFVALGLKIPDSTHSPTGVPAAQVTVETFLVGRHELGVRIVFVTGSPEDKANKGYRIWYKVVGPGEEAPSNPKQLTELFSTKRRKDLLEFQYGDSGKTVYMSAQVENNGKEGPFGPMVSAFIP